MILVDTNIIIDYLDNPTNILLNTIEGNSNLAICGVIQTELLRGVKTKSEKQQIDKIIDNLYYINFEETDWRSLADFFVRLRASGITIPFQDGIIAYLAIKNNCILWTEDKHFELIKKVIPELKLLEVA